MIEKPDFSSFEKVKIKNFKTDESYVVLSHLGLNKSADLYQKITEICNEEQIYHWLFKNIFPEGYPYKSAIDFISIAEQGWKNESNFIFFILHENGQFAGAMDLKTNNTNLCEVGYWFSEKHPGIATNSIGALLKIAKKAGFKKLFAQTKEGNDKSVNVLLRNQFVEDLSYLKPDSKCTRAFYYRL